MRRRQSGHCSSPRIRRLKPGVRFRDQYITDDNSVLSVLLGDHGYPAAVVTSRLEVDTAQHQVGIVWQVASGQRSYFGRLIIDGNQRVTGDLIRGQMAFDYGDLFRQSKLDESQRQLIEVGVFEVATVTGRLERGQNDTIPISVTVKEAPQLAAKIGGGYGSEDDVRLFGESQLRGFMGGARRLDLLVKHSGLEPYHVRLRLTQPAFFSPRTSATISPFARRQDEPGFVLNRAGGDVGLDHRLSAHAGVGIQYTFERIDLDTTEVAQADRDLFGLEEVYNKSSVDLDFTFDNSEPMFRPQMGGFIAVSTRLSGLGLGSRYHFHSVEVEGRKYQAVAGMVVAGRIKIGGIVSFDDDDNVPPEDRFYSGGAFSVRGWHRAELGPRSNGKPTGGKSVIEGNLELRFPIIGIFSGAVFSDAGNVWRGSYEYHLSEVRYSAGLGLRVDTPIGPARLDFARPIFDEDDAIQVHINVGQAF
jgi:outer membrane protein insertion porin family